MMFRRIRGYLLQVVGLEFLDNRARDSFSSPALAKPGRRRRRIEVASRHSGLLRIDLMWFIANRAALTALKYWCMRCQKYSWLATRGSSRSHVWIVTTPSWNIWQRGRGGGGHVDLEGTLSRTSEFLSASTISLIVSNLSQNGGDTYGWRKKRAKRISCLRIFSIIFPTLPRTPFHSLLNCLSTRFFAVFRDILRRYSKTWFFAPSLDKRGRSIFFSKE